MNDKKRLPYLLSSIAIFAAAVICTMIALQSVPKYSITPLNSQWDMSINDVDLTNVSLSHFYKYYNQKTRKHDHLIMKHALPVSDIPNPVILFRSKYSTLKVYVDGKPIYDFGMDYYQKDRFLGKMVHVITLPPDYSGKELVFEMYLSEDNGYGNFEAPIFGSHPDVTGVYVQDNIIIIATGLFMFVFGLTFLCIGLIFTSYVSEIKSLVLGSLFCMNLSAWLLTYYSILSLFVYTELETQIEYFTMYVTVPYCFILLYYIGNFKGNRLYTGIMLVCCGVPLVQFALHYIFNIHMRVTLPFYHLSGLVGFGVLLFYALMIIRKKIIVPENTRIQMTGLFSFAIGQLIHLIIYVLDKFHIPTYQLANKAIISLACLMFAVCQLSTYLVYITASYAKKQENASLSHLAYADGLTNLPNRSKADKLMAELNEATDDYCILSIDLNGLKMVNDKYGHPSGDKYIKDFAKVLNNTFGEEEFCARIGGDEFIVIIRDAGSKDINTLIGRMNSALNVMNALYTEYKRSVSVGFAFRHEAPDGNSHNVYLLADQRMYENKRRMHDEMGITPRL
ncbi:GGDEF domain-containing protein [Butyrivibrio sp. XBB1001]|uniref:GGDEF domain-containing protein n=1 Tax=Butyrivibrio sp. XBB1001 TaxID=1280682 RepID=UPI000414BDAD|nr:GGDEF domain-containing protein [Butyrivibrio sp. XBB1001]